MTIFTVKEAQALQKRALVLLKDEELSTSDLAERALVVKSDMSAAMNALLFKGLVNYRRILDVGVYWTLRKG